MFININEKATEVRFGIRFIRELDKVNTLEREGVKFGAGLELGIPRLMACDTAALSDILYIGTVTEKNRPTPSDVDAFVENHENIEKLFDEVLDELKKSNATKLKMAQLETQLEKEMKHLK